MHTRSRFLLLASLLAPLLTGCGSGAQNRHTLETVVGSVTAPRTGAPERRQAPDPAFVNLRYASLGLSAAGSSTVELDLVNRGREPSGRFRVAVYASPGRVVTADRFLLGSIEVAFLDGSQSRHVTVPFTAPAEPGSYAIQVEVDDRGEVAGDDRTNNASGSEQLIVR